MCINVARWYHTICITAYTQHALNHMNGLHINRQKMSLRKINEFICAFFFFVLNLCCGNRRLLFSVGASAKSCGDGSALKVNNCP